jgi:endonuclease-3
VVSSQTRDDVTDAAVDKLCAALGRTLNLEALLATGEQVIADAISKVGFCRRNTVRLHTTLLSSTELMINRKM